MANGFVKVLKEVYSAKLEELEKAGSRRFDAIREKFEKENPRFRAITQKIKTVKARIKPFESELDKLKTERNNRFPDRWDAIYKAENLTKKNYQKLLVKITLGNLPETEAKKALRDFCDKDYLAEAMGA